MIDLPDDAFYFVATPSTFAIGPMGGPMYLAWNFEQKQIIEQRQLDELLKRLNASLRETVGDEIGAYTRPRGFTGVKSRRLIVTYARDTVPPWGEWTSLSNVESKRRTFTSFRAAVNSVLSPHEVDHIDFAPECCDEHLKD